MINLFNDMPTYELRIKKDDWEEFIYMNEKGVFILEKDQELRKISLGEYYTWNHAEDVSLRKVNNWSKGCEGILEKIEQFR